LVKKFKNNFYLIIFKKNENNHTVELIYLKMLTFQHFMFLITFLVLRKIAYYI